jgi:DNA invertase Pin-like site-specific DNA recombinase
MRKAYSYLRFSSRQQADGDSGRRQDAGFDGWLKQHPEASHDPTYDIIRDEGLSGYTGEHLKRGKLKGFMNLVRRRKIARDSYLVVESLDRLTREEPETSLRFVMELLDAGITIVALSPPEEYSKGLGLGPMVTMLLELFKGHGYSKQLSERLRAVKAEKRKKARDDKAPHGDAVPAWIELTDGKYRVKRDAGRTVKMVFDLCIKGMGTLAIANHLEAEGVPAVGRTGRWVRSYVDKMLHSRAAIGVYEPCDGDPVPGYFPAVVTEKVFYAAQAAIADRDGRCGRPGKKGDFRHCFQGLMRDAVDRCSMYIVVRKGRRYFVSEKAFHCDPDHTGYRPFPVDHLVDGLLSQLRELKASDLFSGTSGVAEAEGRVAEAEKQLAVAGRKLDADPESVFWQRRADKWEAERRRRSADLEEARREAANPTSMAWEDVVTSDPDRLRAAILATVESVDCVVTRSDDIRTCVAQVRFKSDATRTYVVRYRPRKSPAHTEGPPEVHSWTGAELDLRKSEDARMVETLNTYESGM